MLNRLFKIGTATLALATSLISGATEAEGKSIAAFDFASNPSLSCYCNANFKILPTGGKDGAPCAEIVLGGVSSDKSGAFQCCKVSPGDKSSKCLSFWIKGAGKPKGGFVVLINDKDGMDWCWNGPRWEASAEIACYDAWRKVSCKLEDFIPKKAASPPSRLDASKVSQIHFAVGRELKDPKSEHCRFLLSDVRFDSFDSEAQTQAQTPALPPVRAGSSLPAPAPVCVPKTPRTLPSFVSWKLATHYQESSPVRSRISLNNYWLLQPVDGFFVSDILSRNGELGPLPLSASKEDEGLYMKVPGRWDGRLYNVLNAKGETVKDWKGKPLSDCALAWYRRELDIPAAWKGRSIGLEFERLNGNATLFINGQKLTEFRKSGGIDASKYLVCGETNEIALLFEAPELPLKKDDERYKEFVLQKMGSAWWYGWHEGPGINGNVWLNVIPVEGRIDDAFVMPDVARKRLAVKAGLSGAGVFSGSLSGTVMDGAEKVLELKGVPVSFGTEAKEFDLSEAWPDPVLWSPSNPKLYTLKLRLSSQSGLVDERDFRFGFRQFGIDKGDFILNGRKTHPKFLSSQCRLEFMPEGAVRELLAELKKMNYDGLIVESADENLIGACDELGLMSFVRHVFPPLVRQGEYLPGVPSSGYPYYIYLSQSPLMLQARAELEDAVGKIVRRFRNSPSIVIWGINPLLCYNSDWINPNNFFKERPAGDIIKASLAEEAFLRKLDPTRLVMHSMGSSTGEIIACNPYPTFCNVSDEWADWPMNWSAVKNKPLVLEEVALPFCWCYSTWHVESQKRRGVWNDSKQLFIEQSARVLGEKAYSLYGKDWDSSLWFPLGERKISEKPFSWTLVNRAAAECSAHWMRRVYPAWRFYDVSGLWPFEPLLSGFEFGEESVQFKYPDVTRPGKKPDSGKRPVFTKTNVIHDALVETLRPFMARIGGRPERFSSREHCYSSGETVSKQIMLSNDAPEDLDVKAVWSLEKPDGKVVAKGDWSGRMLQGSVAKIPFEFAAPQVSAKEDFTLRMKAEAGKLSSHDELKIRVFPSVGLDAPPAELLLYDEKGGTASMLEKLGAKSVPLKDAAQLDSHKTLVVGRGSFTKEFLAKAKELDLGRRLRDGLTMLVFEQDGSGALAPYLEERRSRETFMKTAGHPILAGLDDEDLHHWRGPSDFVVAYPDSSYAKPERFIPWGSEGCVASYVMDKPALGAFRCLLDCDADLSRTPLLEYGVGEGRCIFCQLDVTGRIGTDPVATRIAKALVAYAANPLPFPSCKAAYAGDSESLKMLQEDFHVSPSSISSGAELDGCQALILGNAPFAGLSPEDCSKFLQRGGRILVLPRDADGMKALPLPVKPAAQSVKMRGAVCPVGASPILNGLGSSDFYFNLPLDALALSELPSTAFSIQPAVFASVPDGKGECVFLQTGPKELAKRHGEDKARRILSCVLSNLGVRPDFNFDLFASGDTDIDLASSPALFSIDIGSKGEEKGWQSAAFDDKSWSPVKISCSWESQGVVDENPSFKDNGNKEPYDGDAWYRFHVKIPEAWKGRELFFDAERIDDLDWTYFNGKLIGHTGKETPKYWEFHRKYKIPQELVNFGADNVLAVKVRDFGMGGGMMGPAKISWPGAQRAKDILYPRPSRNILDFDPNHWRQW